MTNYSSPLPQLPQIGYEFADLGSVFTPDGREHQVAGHTPVVFSSVHDSLRESPPEAVATAALAAPAIGWPDWATPDFLKEKHIGTRLVVGIVAIGLILIAALRLTR